MKAVCWMSKDNVQVLEVPDPKILNPRDAIVKITSTAICGSDLHLYNNFIPTMQKGDILGHEFMGEVVEVGSAVSNLKAGDRVIVPFCISCGNCFFCRKGLTSLCDNSNPNAKLAETMYGHATSGLYGYSHLTGGYAGGQAEYVRVPFADTNPFKVPAELSDDQVLFLTDIFPTGYMAADNCNIEPGDTVAIWGAGPVGQFAIKSAYLLGAERVICIDQVPERLAMAQIEGKAEIINFAEVEDIHETLKEMTGGMGPDSCMDAVGLEAHGTSVGEIYDWVKVKTGLATDRPHVLRQAIYSCRKGGTVSVPGVYGGLLDKMPLGSFMNKGLTMKTGQTHVHKYLPKLLQHIMDGDIDPSFVITHRISLDDAPEYYKIFEQKKDDCIKVVMKPGDFVTNGNHAH